MQNKGLKYYPDILRELKSGVLRTIYFIAVEDDYLLNRFTEQLKKTFNYSEAPGAFEKLYADEIGLEEIIDKFNNSSSLFTDKRIIIVKRCERYKSLDLLDNYTAKETTNEILILVFDSEKVKEKKLWKNYLFFDFSVIEPQLFISLIKDEFERNNCIISDSTLNQFVDTIPDRMDVASQEIMKISTIKLPVNGEGKKIVSDDIIFQIAGYDKEFSIPELITSIINKNQKQCYKIANYLFEKSALSEIFLISVISSYFLDLLCFKSISQKRLSNNDIYQKYKIWGDRLDYARSNHHFVNKDYLLNTFRQLIYTDLKLKSTMVEPKILIYSLLQDLLK